MAAPQYTSAVFPSEEVICSKNITLVIKWRRMRWAGHVALKRERCKQDFGGET
jgi:hypothetical protein